MNHDIETDTDDTCTDTLDPVSGVNLSAKVVFQIGKASEEMSRSARSMDQLTKQLEHNTPLNGSTVTAGAFVTGVPLVLDLGSPDAGMFWEAQVFAVGGTDVNIVAAGTWGLYIGSVVSTTGAGMGNLVDTSTAMPYAQRYSRGQLIVNDQEHLFAIVYNGTNTQTYVANVQFRAYNVTSGGGRVTYSV